MSLPAAVIQRSADLDAVHARAAAVAGRLAQAHAELVDVAREVLRDDLWAGTGIRSPQHWLMVFAGLSPSRARDVLRLARPTDELPDVVALLRAGRLGIDQATVVAQFVPGDHGKSAAELAEQTTVPQLRRALSRYAFGDLPRIDPVTGEQACDEPDPFDERASLSMHSHDGRFELRFEAPVSVGALVDQAVREAKDALFRAGATDATLADALVEVASRSVRAGEVVPESRASRYRVFVHLDTAADAAWIGRGTALPRHQLRRITCDGRLTPVWESEGTPVRIGRSARIVPDRLRRLVESRDAGCRFPGCTSTGHADVHHLIHWADGGSSDLDNLLLLCPWHHDRHHQGEFTIAGDPNDPGGLAFQHQTRVAHPAGGPARHPGC